MTRRVLGLFAPYRRKVAVWLAITLAVSILGITAPLLTKAVFDKALFPSGGQTQTGLLVLLVGLMIASVLLGGALALVQTYISNVVGQGVMHDLRQRLFGHLRQMSLRFFTSTRPGEIQSRIANDVGGIDLVVTQTASTVVVSSVFVTFSIAAMAWLSWPLTAISLVVVPGFALLTRKAGRMRREMQMTTQQTLAEMTVITQETLSLSGALLAKMFDPAGRSEHRYREESERLARLRVRQEMLSRTLLGLSQTFFLASPALIYLAAGLLSATGSWHLTPGTLVAFIALQARLYSPLQDLMGISIELNASSVLFERIFEYLDLPQDVTDGPDARPLAGEHVDGRVALRNVHFRYDAGTNGHRPWTLEDIDLVIEPGQLAAIVGPSGAGKTTLSYLIPRLYDVNEGAVEIGGHDVRSITLESLAGIVGMVTQETYLLHTSVRQNLLFARPDASDAELERAASAAYIHERIVELPAGYDTLVGERGYRLSGGEKQRLAIARVILKDARILILDEATSSLDTLSERLVQEALASVVAGRTTLAIAHRLSTVMAADVIFVLDRGRLVERGTHAELLARGGLYARLCAEQFGVPLPLAAGG